MGLLFEIQRFLKKIGFSDIVLMGATAYLIYKIIKKKSEQSIKDKHMETIDVIDKNNSEEVIFDSNSKVYSLVRNFDIVFQSKDLEDIQRYKRMEKLRNRIEQLN